jgi:hypothetical protein
VRRKSVPYGEADKRDAEGLQHAIDILNEGKTDRTPGWVSPTSLARFTREFKGDDGPGGQRQQWEAYLAKRRRVKPEDKLIAGMFFAQFEQTRHLKVQDIFPSWPYSKLTPFAAAAQLPPYLFAYVGSAPAVQAAYNRLSELFFTATGDQRSAILAAAHKVLGLPMPKSKPDSR